MSDFVAGGCVGLAQVAIGHPFDTTMVLIQNNKKWTGLHIKNYYRGWRFPLVSASLFNFTVFPVYERSLSYTNNAILSGALAGFCASPLLFGFEVGKILQQTRQPLNISVFTRSRGFYSLASRETLACSAYFSTYNYMKEKGNGPLIAGGLSGLVNWGLTYPLDVLKSRQIAQNISMKNAFNQGKLYKGFSICMVRAVLVNAMNFWTYETVKKYLESK